MISLKLVGIVEDNFQIVQDDDAALGNQFAVLSPALTRQLARCCAYYSLDALQIDGGAHGQASVVTALNKVLPDLGPFAGAQTFAPFVAKAEQAIRPEAIAFGVFGLLCGLAALLDQRPGRRPVSQAEFRRRIGAARPGRWTGHDYRRRAHRHSRLGRGRDTAGGGSWRSGCPRWRRLAPVRPVYPERGVAFDWTVLGCGSVLLVVVLSSVALLMAVRESPQRVARRTGGTERSSKAADAAAAVGLPPAAVTGIRSVFGAGSRGDAAPVRSALLGVGACGGGCCHVDHLWGEPQLLGVASCSLTGGTGTMHCCRASLAPRTSQPPRLPICSTTTGPSPTGPVSTSGPSSSTAEQYLPSPKARTPR